MGEGPLECYCNYVALSGSSSAVERQLPKLDVAGSIPVSRSNLSIGSGRGSFAVGYFAF
jgi:hypothetical protein